MKQTTENNLDLAISICKKALKSLESAKLGNKKVRSTSGEFSIYTCEEEEDDLETEAVVINFVGSRKNSVMVNHCYPKKGGNVCPPSN